MTANDPATVELRRYPSRKLYNKGSSSYVRLNEVAEMIRAGAQIRVEDTETGEDVTRQVLLQIILEQENQSEQAILSADLLTDMIRMHQSKASELMAGLIEQTVMFLRSQQEQLASQMRSSGLPVGLASPWSMFDPAQMQGMQREFQQRLVSLWGVAPSGRKTEPASARAPDPTSQDELDALKARIDHLEKKLSSKAV